MTSEAQAVVSRLLDDIGCEVEKEHFKGGKNVDTTPCKVAKKHKDENPDYYPKKKKPKGWKEKLVWVKEAEDPKNVLRQGSEAAIQAVLAAARDIAAMRHPSVAQLLKKYGYGYEAGKVAALVKAIDAMGGPPVGE